MTVFVSCTKYFVAMALGAPRSWMSVSSMYKEDIAVRSAGDMTSVESIYVKV
jgi:hypothetical protein